MLIDQQTKASAMPSNAFPQMHWTPEMISRFWDWQSQYPEVYFTYPFGREIASSGGLEERQHWMGT
jgi:hypothetical protein